MVNADVLNKYKKRYPVKKSTTINKQAQAHVARLRSFEKHVHAPPPKQLITTPLSHPPVTSQEQLKTPDGSSLAQLGSPLVQRQFLRLMGLSPPNDVVDLDSWVLHKMGELSAVTKKPLTLEQWVSMQPNDRTLALGSLNNPALVFSANQQPDIDLVNSGFNFGAPASSIPTPFKLDGPGAGPGHIRRSQRLHDRSFAGVYDIDETPFTPSLAGADALLQAAATPLPKSKKRTHRSSSRKLDE